MSVSGSRKPIKHKRKKSSSTASCDHNNSAANGEKNSQQEQTSSGNSSKNNVKTLNGGARRHSISPDTSEDLISEMVTVIEGKTRKKRLKQSHSPASEEPSIELSNGSNILDGASSSTSEEDAITRDELNNATGASVKKRGHKTFEFKCADKTVLNCDERLALLNTRYESLNNSNTLSANRIRSITWDNFLCDYSMMSRASLAIKRKPPKERHITREAKEEIKLQEFLDLVHDNFNVDVCVPQDYIEDTRSDGFQRWYKTRHLEGPLPDRPSGFCFLIETYRRECRPEMFISKKKTESYTVLKDKIRQKIEKLEESRGKVANASEEKGIRKKINNLRKETQRLERKQTSLATPPTSARKSNKPAGKKQFGKGKKFQKTSVVPIFNKIVTSSAQKTHPKQVKGKNFKQLLNKHEAQKQKLERLSAANPEKATHKKQSIAWGNALAKAQGAKLKNDPTLLKKAIKKKEKKKQSSQKQWNERKQHVERNQKHKIQKRTTNLQARTDKRKEKRFRKGVKKGHIIPGFANSK